MEEEAPEGLLPVRVWGATRRAHRPLLLDLGEGGGVSWRLGLWIEHIAMRGEMWQHLGQMRGGWWCFVEVGGLEEEKREDMGSLDLQ
ncbi:hypothetical protein Tsubulata_038987 [Turnera subulata]|uniref:Uncharacterized protein n=1 Tax=Turnera subulata TaxID=218843 RepID=A0A9Q0G1L3_9ROSI|nr:hypothetical protein Tsubulata_038987 [Turnera subulata]